MAKSKGKLSGAAAVQEAQPVAPCELVLTGAASFMAAGHASRFVAGVPVEVQDEELRRRLLASGLFSVPESR